jgi:hypothetical protein
MRQHEPAVAFDYIVAKLLLQFWEETLGGEIAGQLGQWHLSWAKPDRRRAARIVGARAAK